MGWVSLPASDTWALMIPILALFALAMFGLDERLVNKRGPRNRRSFCEVDGDGPSDPDGKPWRKRPRRQIEARIIARRASARMESRLDDLRV